MKTRTLQYLLLPILLSFLMPAQAHLRIDPFSPSTTFKKIKPSLPLHHIWVPLYFTKATIIAHFLHKKSLHLLSHFGQAEALASSNELWLEDTKQHLATLTKIIHHLDQPATQFSIKAKIINIDREFRQKLGVIFHTIRSSASSGYTNQTAQDDSGATASSFALTIAKFPESQLLNMQINALEKAGHALLISAPSLIALDNQPATIESGAEIPYEEETANGGTSAAFKKAVLRLKVVPKRIQQNKILLHITVNQDKASALTVNGVPAVETQALETTVILKNKQTVILGGIIRHDKTRDHTSIALVNKIPILGQLLSSHTSDHHDEELLITISPTILAS